MGTLSYALHNIFSGVIVYASGTILELYRLVYSELDDGLNYLRAYVRCEQVYPNHYAFDIAFNLLDTFSSLSDLIAQDYLF